MTENMKKLVLLYNFREETNDISGVKIHCVIKEHEHPTDDVLVFIHGTASSSVTFFDVMKAISLSHRQKCIAIDLPNFGISGNMDIEKYTSNEEMCDGYADIIGNTLIQLNT
jgi:pimeloyl-ACP methyl ester carboxylesterase